MAYFTKEELEAVIGETITDEDYQKAHDYAKAFIETYTGQVFETETAEEIRKIDDVIPLEKYPVQSISAVVILPEEETLTAEQYLVYRWGLEILPPLAGRQVKVSYTAGWETIPQPIKGVALELAKRLLVPTDKPTPTPMSISSGGVSMTYLTSDIDHAKPTDDDRLNAVLNAYRREKTL